MTTYRSMSVRRRARLARTLAVVVVLAVVIVVAVRLNRDDVVAAPAVSGASTTVPSNSPTASPSGAATNAGTATKVGAKPNQTAPVTPWVAPTQIRLEAPVPGTTNLQPVMIAAYDRAAAAATADGVTLTIRSGWRSPEFQQVLFERAVRRYGSAEKAAALVKPPEQSMHVQGLAVDLRDRAAGRWLEEHGEQYGLCRRYENEWWHFEYTAGPCAALAADASG